MRGPATAIQRLILGFAAILLAPLCAAAAPGLFDFGTEKSEVWEGFVRVTAKGQYDAGAGHGWRTTEGLRSVAKAFRERVEIKSRGTMEPPPIWTNPITEDAIIGDRSNAFQVRVEPGEYDIYAVFGTSDPGLRAQYFDFTVRVGGQERRVQIEGCYQFRTVRFRARAGSGPLAIEFDPASKWVVNAIVVWPVSDAEKVERDIIRPFEDRTFLLPPEEWAKWKEEPEPDPGPPHEPGAADKARGFTIFTRPYLECVYPGTNPRPSECDPTLRIFATPGEYEPANFIVRPIRDLRGATVTAGAVGPVPSSAIDVRHVRYMRARPNYTVSGRYRVVPDILERFGELDLKAGRNERVWLTLHIPEDARSGLYRGEVSFRCGEAATKIPIELRVLPIRLREDPSKIFGIYYRHPLDLMFEAKDDASREYFRHRAEMEHRDMVAHGTRNVVLSIYTPPADAAGNFAFRWEPLAEKLTMWKAHGFVGPVVMSINTDGVYEKHMKERYGSHLRGVKEPPPAFSEEITRMVKAIEVERIGRGWPEFLYYPVDEPGHGTAEIAFMVTVLKACKAAGVRTYATADPTVEAFAPMRPHVDVWCTQPFAPDRETVLADSKARHVEYWCYPNHVNGENDHTPVSGARMTYGFGFWRSGFRTLIPWIYSASSGDPFNYLDGYCQDFFSRSEPDGTPMPVVLWEAYREGYDDYRYIHTLERLIAEAKAKGGTAAQAAPAAEKELRSVWDAIRVQEKYKHDGLWSPAEFDVYRWLIARQIIALQDAMEGR
jgi:hypothetical protein